jgi:hypothetical protein
MIHVFLLCPSNIDVCVLFRTFPKNPISKVMGKKNEVNNGL